jgi:hypothetical protein
MTLTATEIYDRLTELDSDDETNFTLQADTTEADIQTWYDGVDTQTLESEIDSQIARTAITDLQASANIGPDNLSVAEVITSRNNDPADFDAAYVIRSDRTVVQYFKPYVGGKEPIPESDVTAEMESHVSKLVTRAVNAELLSRAETEFSA